MLDVNALDAHISGVLEVSAPKVPLGLNSNHEFRAAKPSVWDIPAATVHKFILAKGCLAVAS